MLHLLRDTVDAKNMMFRAFAHVHETNIHKLMMRMLTHLWGFTGIYMKSLIPKGAKSISVTSLCASLYTRLWETQY